MRDRDPDLPIVFTRAEATAAGMTGSQVQRRQAGRWRVLRRGVYCLESVWEAADRNERYRIETRAALKALGGSHVASHASAAVIHRLPQPRGDEPVWLTTTPGNPCRYLDRLVVEAATVPDADRWTRDGVPVTSPARTVADCLRHLDVIDAVAIADAALRKQPDLGRLVVRVLKQCETWPYAAVAAARLPLVDGRRESHAESWSYVLMHQEGLPLPEPQVVVRDESGTVVARVDGLWRDRQLVGEVDGLVKYGIGADLSAQDARRALVEEKRREERLNQLGLDVVRWGTTDLHRPKAWAEMLRSRLAQPPRRRLAATFGSMPALLLSDQPAQAA